MCYMKTWQCFSQGQWKLDIVVENPADNPNVEDVIILIYNVRKGMLRLRIRSLVEREIERVIACQYYD